MRQKEIQERDVTKGKENNWFVQCRSKSEWYDRLKKLKDNGVSQNQSDGPEGLLLHPSKHPVIIVVVRLATAKIDVVVAAVSRFAICVTHLHVALIRHFVRLRWIE